MIDGAAERMAAASSRPRGDVVVLGAQNPPLGRNRSLERLLTAQAAEFAGVQCVALSNFAEHRAGEGPIRDLENRDLVLEALEELADARNYLVWQAIREHDRPEPNGDVVAGTSRALVLVVQAFDQVVHLHDLRAA